MTGGVVVKDDQGVSKRRSAAKRTAVLLALLALAFYVAIFILKGGD